MDAERNINLLMFLLEVTTTVLPAISSAHHQHHYLMIIAWVKNHSGYLSQLLVHSRKCVDTEIIKVE